MAKNSCLLGAACFIFFTLSSNLAMTAQAQTPSQYDFVLNGPKAKASLQQHAGQIVYVDFWASWCGPCRQSFPFMNALQKKYGKSGLKIIAISVDKNLDEAQTFLQQNPADFQIAFDADGNVPKQYGVKGMPSSFLIGRDGKLLYSHKGFKAQDQEAIEEQIKLALENKK